MMNTTRTTTQRPPPPPPPPPPATPPTTPPPPATPSPCSYTAWTAWSACSTLCGSGTSARSRLLAAPGSASSQLCTHLNQTRPCFGTTCPHKVFRGEKLKANLLLAQYS